MNILEPQPTAENPFIVEDYPYGFRLRTQMRVWVEFRKGFGYRYVTQTLNPKNGKWNKPKSGNYYPIVIAYTDPADGHIKQMAFSGYDAKEFQEFEIFIGDNKILESEPFKTQFRILKARYNAQKHFTWKVVSPEKARPIADQLRDLNNVVAYEYTQLLNQEKDIT